MPASAPTFTPAQLATFYDRISLPAPHRHAPGTPSLQRILASHAESLALLSALVRHCLAAIPFENLSLHYSPHRTIVLDPQYLYEKIVASPHNGRGGYCMENNGLMNVVLRTIGFDVASVGAKVNESTGADDGSKAYRELTYLGWTHMVNLVYLPRECSSSSSSGGGGDDDDDEKEEGEAPEPKIYLVDVGFGGGGPSQPMLVREGETALNMPGAPSASTAADEGQVVRLVREVPPGVSARRRRHNEAWVYQRRLRNTNTQHHMQQEELEAEFRPFYAFTEQEFLPADYEVMNHWTSTSSTMFFTWEVVCLRKILDEAETRIVGDLVLANHSLTRRVYGEKEMDVVLTSEEERVAALEKYFGIRLKEYERKAILGTAAAIKG